jgi:glycine cleavage system protein P-like pyridoxal-binding family
VGSEPLKAGKDGNSMKLVSIPHGGLGTVSQQVAISSGLGTFLESPSHTVGSEQAVGGLGTSKH